MQLRIEGKKEHKGFLLKKPTVLEGCIIVLTGRNGAGKTRLIESLGNQHSTAYLNDNTINNQDIRLVAHAQLNPSFGPGYNDTQFQTKITATLQLYDEIKDELNLPFDPAKAKRYRDRGQERVLDYEALFRLFQSISKRLNKPASELNHEDIILHYEEPLRNLLGMQSMATIANQYIKRLHNNRYNEWRNKEKGANIQYWSEEEFFKQFGERPWVIVNRILEDAFDGKFFFSLPDEESQSYTYKAQLIQNDNKLPVLVENLSSGEKTLLWLALTLFNSQYYDADIVKIPKILLIDEPDIYLHPKMIVKMYKTLESFSNNFESIVVITTHSPTTVALAPSEEVYLIKNNSISPIEKDSAISELLDGVTQISLSPRNRRQVFVESQYDADIYQAIYSKVAFRSAHIDPKITLNFVSSGPKMPDQQLKDKATQIFGVDDEYLLCKFVEGVNGIGNCSQVVGQVEALCQKENETVRGIIDWDLENKPSRYVSVLSENYAYSIENIALDPICILLFLHIENPEKFTMEIICGSDINWREWLKNDELLQKSIDRFIHKVLGRENKKDSKLSYISGKVFLTDSEYLLMEGHSLEALVKEKYPGLKAYAKRGKEGELKYSLVSRSMINLTNCNFIPSAFELVFASAQK